MKKLIFIIISFFTITFALAQDVRLLVSNIHAEPLNSQEIFVSWQLPNILEDIDTTQLSLILYRSPQQKAGNTTLEDLKPVVTLPYNTTSYTDTPDKDSSFYYTVIIATEATSQQYLIIPAKNTTAMAVQVLSHPHPAHEHTQETVQDKPNSATGLRNTPLPYLKLSMQSTEIPINPERKHDTPTFVLEESEKQRRTSVPQLPDPYIFRQEQETENVGEDFILQEIIHNQFANKEYEATEQALRDFLSINHSKDAIDRGTFYLGETLLYQGKYQQALSCFLQVQDRFPDLTSRWIQAALDGYQLPIIEQ
jgi:hypothetical protein